MSEFDQASSGPPSVGSVAGDSFFGRLVAVFTAPGRAMDGVAQRPRWWQAMLISACLAALFGATAIQIIGPESMESMKDSWLMRNAPPGTLEKAMEEMASPSPGLRIRTAVQSGLGGFGAYALAGLALGLFAKLAAGRGTLKQSLGVVGWAGLISGVLGLILTWAIVMAKNTMIGVSMGPAMLLGDPDPASIVYKLLTKLDLFSLWSLAVIVIGFQRVHGFARAKAATVVLVPWAIYVVVSSVTGGLFGG